MTDAEKMEFDLYKANKELKQIINNWDFPTKRIMNWVTSGDPTDNSWNKDWGSSKQTDYSKEFNNN